MTVAFLFAQISPLRLSAAAVAEVVLLVVGAGFLEIRWQHERTLLDNLGVTPLALGALFAGPALVGEIAFRIVVAVVA